MPTTEPIQGGPYPVPTDAPDGPNQMAALAGWAAGRLVMRFASPAARDAAITSPVEGMVAMTGTAATLTEWTYQSGGWHNTSTLQPVDYTPALTASVTNPTLGTGGSATGRYARSGSVITCWFSIALAGTGVNAGAGAYYVSVPVPIRAPELLYPSGHLWIYDASTLTSYLAMAYPATADKVQFRPHGTTAMTAAIPIVPAAGDALRGLLTYEAA